jgi:hypothetical protein
VAGYVLMAIAGAVTWLLLDAIVGLESLDSMGLPRYWSQVTGAGVVVAVAAGFAGAVTVT